MCSLQRNYDVIRNWERFETGPLTVWALGQVEILRIFQPCWIQIVWHSDGMSEIIFWKSFFLK